MDRVKTTRGIIELGPIVAAKTSDFTPPEGWKLYGRHEREFITPDGKKVLAFHELWLHPSSKSGIVTYATYEEKDGACAYGYKHLASEVYYVVEGYGIGTIDPKTLGEIGGFAPIQRTEHSTIEDARLALRYLMEDDITLIRGGSCLARELAVPQLARA